MDSPRGAASSEDRTREEGAKKWTRVCDKKSGKYYYWNRVTNKTTWRCPAEVSAIFNKKVEACNTSGRPQSVEPRAQRKSIKDVDLSKPIPSTCASEANFDDATMTRSVSVNRRSTQISELPDGLDQAAPEEMLNAVSHQHESIVLSSIQRKEALKHASSVPPGRGLNQVAPMQPHRQQTPPAVHRTNPPGSALSVPVPANNRIACDSPHDSSTAASVPRHSSTSPSFGCPVFTDPPCNNFGQPSAQSPSVRSKTRPNTFDLPVAPVNESLVSSVESLTFSKHRSNALSRFLRVGEFLSEEKLMCFQDTLIRKSLLKCNRHIDKESIQSFKNIMSYMEDRKSRKEPIAHVQKLLKAALMSSEALQDEMYLHVCKQVTKHPNIYHCLRGWDLLRIFLATFPPSPNVAPFLKMFIKLASSTNRSADIQRRALLCVDHVARIMALGHRAFPPSLVEIEAIANFEPVDIIVHLIDDSSKLLQIDSYTVVKDFRNTVGIKCSLSCTESFNLFAVPPSGKFRALDGDVRVLDVVSSWYDQGSPESAEEKAHAEDREGAGSWKFVYRAELVLDIDRDNIVHDTMAVHLIYSQALSDIQAGKYPYAKTIHQAVMMGALRLQATYGNYRVEVHTQNWILSMLTDLFPVSKRDKFAFSSLLGLEDRMKTAQSILVQYMSLKGSTPHDAKVTFVKYAQQAPLYGCSWHSVNQLLFKELPSVLLLAISAKGVMLVDPNGMATLKHFPYDHVVTWGHTLDRFILVVGNAIEQRKMYFKTTDGVEMNRLLGDYIKTMVAGAREVY